MEGDLGSTPAPTAAHADSEAPRLPNLLILGAAKSGTSSLYRYLEEHPDIFMCPSKEPSFFLWADGDFEIHGPGAERVQRRAVKDLNAYRALFAGATTEAVLGEASTGYLHTEGTAERIKRHLPDGRLITILRNPIQRAYSAFLHARRNGFEPLRDFEQALEEESARIRDRWVGLTHYTDVGMYAQHLERYLRVFPAHQLRVYLHDDLARNAAAICKDVFRFLALDETFQPSVDTVYNKGAPVRSTMLDALLRSSRTRSVVRRLVPDRIARPVYNQLRKLNEQRVGEIPANLRRRLADVFENDVMRLCKMLGRDLTPWLENRTAGAPGGDGPGMQPGEGS